MEHKSDLRVTKTRRNIQDTLIRLLSQKDFESITVQNILDEALINRTTFYKYYQDKYNLADIMIEDLLMDFTTDLKARFSTNEDLSVLLRRFYESLLKRRYRMLALIKVRTHNHNIEDEIRKILKENYCKYILISSQSANERQISYQSELYAAIVIASVHWLLELGDEEGISIIVEHSMYQTDKMIHNITKLF